MPNEKPIPQQIPIEKIHDLPGVTDFKLPEKSYGTLVSSILVNGLREPVILRPQENGEYQLVHGYRRRKAAELAKLKTLDALVYDMTEKEAKDYRLAVAANPDAPIPGKLITPDTKTPASAKDLPKAENAVPAEKKPEAALPSPAKATVEKPVEKKAETAPPAPAKPAEEKPVDKKAESAAPPAVKPDEKKPAEPPKDSKKAAEAPAPAAPVEEAPVVKEEVRPEPETPVEEAPAGEAPAAEEIPEAPADLEGRIRAFLSGLLEHMGIEAEINVGPKTENGILVTLEGPKLGALIGHRGETLDAVQQLTNYSVNRGRTHRTRIHIDAENYRAKREESLKRLANKVAGKVVKYRRNITLEPMNAYERHVIHEALQDYPDVITYSTGTEPNRRTVVAFSRGKHAY